MSEGQVDFASLSTAEKILHVQDLWDRIAASATEEVELTEAQRADLDRRVEAHRADPDRGSTWEDVKKRIRARR